AAAAVAAALLAWAVRDTLRVPMTVRTLPVAPAGTPAAAGSAPRTVALPDGRTRDLAAPPGKLLILHYWATWCPPCVTEFPQLVAFWKEFGRKPGVELLAVSVDEDWKTVDEWMKKNGIAGIPLALDPGRTSARAFGTEKFPETYVLSPSGQVVDKYIGAVNWSAPALRKTLENLLAAHSPARAGG
ncbi:MAG TPA: TlpA disulfide reductase family protein, partial [Thermoanaerobaculia bacterium]|nr:TlpA disulfide reductase family protein [Thermoanaerobaculia bacterium]